jgi:hypothetical protein
MLYPVELRGRSPKLYHFWGQIAAGCRGLPLLARCIPVQLATGKQAGHNVTCELARRDFERSWKSAAAGLGSVRALC